LTFAPLTRVTKAVAVFFAAQPELSGTPYILSSCEVMIDGFEAVPYTPAFR
jgi:hypothetical protein